MSSNTKFNWKVWDTNVYPNGQAWECWVKYENSKNYAGLVVKQNFSYNPFCAYTSGTGVEFASMREAAKYVQDKYNEKNS